MEIKSDIKIVDIYLIDSTMEVKPTDLSPVVFAQKDLVLVGGNEENLVMDIISGGEIKDHIAKYNDSRVKFNNRKILENTGKKVPLEPLTLSDLEWQIKQ